MHLSHNTQITSLVGPAGSGKTTTAIALAQALALRGYKQHQIAIFINDAGGVTEARSKHARIIVYPNGCFTCQDEALLLKELHRLSNEGVKHVILEGFGMTAGHETRHFLEHAGYPFDIIALISADSFSRQLLEYGNIMPTHLRAVTAGIIVTRTIAGFVPSVVEAFIDQNCQFQTIVRANTVRDFPPDLLEVICSEKRPSHHTCGHPECSGHHHDHFHGHGHHHDHGEITHGWRTFAFRARPWVTLADLQSATAALTNIGAVRLKGVLAGTSFNFEPAGRTWNETVSDSRGGQVTVYLKESEPSASLSLFLPLIEELLGGGRSHEIIRLDYNLDPNEVVALIRKKLKKLRKLEPCVSQHGTRRLVTHPEEALQVLKEMARRPQVEAEWFLPVIEQCVAYWVRCGQWLATHEKKVDAQALAVHHLEVAVSLAWWTKAYGDRFDASLVSAVDELKPAVMLARGLLSVQTLRADPFWRYWQLKEYETALAFGTHFTHEERSRVMEARGHLEFLKNNQAA